MADEVKTKEKMDGGYLCPCGTPVQFKEDETRTLCYVCGRVNVKPEGDAEHNWLPCLEPESFEWFMPAGVVGQDVPIAPNGISPNGIVDYDALVALPMSAQVLYIEPIHQNKMTRMDWINKFGRDPAIVLRNMRKRTKARPVIYLGR